MVWRLTEPSYQLAAAGGLLLIAFGVYVWRLGHVRESNRWFGAYAMAAGAGSLISNVLTRDDPLAPAMFWVMAFLSAVIGIALGGFMLRAPRPIATHERGALGLALLAALPVTGYRLATLVDSRVRDLFNRGLAASPTFHVDLADIGRYVVGLTIGTTILYAALFFMALKYARSDPADREYRTQLLLFAAVLIAPTGTSAGTNVFSTGPNDRALAHTAIAASLVLAVLWLHMSRRDAHPRTLVAVALLPLVLTLAAMIARAAFEYRLNQWNPLLSFTLLAYAALRHQVLGIDVKLRWTLSKTTVAAVFIAVFFVASEAAQQFFGERFEGAYTGIFAAGLLVFAIAPLQRFAERLAEKAVPLAPAGVAEAPASEKHEVYRDAIRYSYRDGALTRREETHLASLAQHLGIGAADSVALRHEVEDERAQENRS